MKQIRIIAKYGPHLARIIKLSFQRQSVVVTSFQELLSGMKPRRVGHTTYPPDGRIHWTTDELKQTLPSDGSPPDPLNLYDARGRFWGTAGPPLIAFTGQKQLAAGSIYLSKEAMSKLKLRGAPQQHDLIIEGASGGVEFGYAVDLVQADCQSMATAVERRRIEAESVNEGFLYQSVEQVLPWVLLSIRAKGLGCAAGS